MGKGNRKKLIKAQAEANTTSVFTKTKKAKNESPAWVSTLVVVLIIALLVSFIALTVISEGGYLLRWTSVVESDNYTVTGTMMSYFFYSSYNGFMNQYGEYAQYFGLDTSKSLREQQYADGDTTWFDYFMDASIEQAEKFCVYCEEAKIRGIKLSDDDYVIIDTAIDNLKSAAAEANYSTEGYVSALYGIGVKLKDVRLALEMSQLAAKTSEAVQEELTNEINETEINTYYDENKSDFWTASILKYAFTAPSTKTDDTSYDYEAEKAKMDQFAAELLACTTEESYKKYVAEYVAETNFDALYEAEAEKHEESVLPNETTLSTYKADVIASAVENALDGKTVEKTTSTEVLDEIFNTIEIALAAKVTSAIETINDDSYAYSDPTVEEASDEVKWICDSTRAKGDMTLISEAGDDDYTVTVYMMKEPMHRDETLTRNVGHILFTTETYITDEIAKEKADSILAEFKSGDMTKEAFEALAKEYNEDSSTFYDDVVKGQMVAEFEEWLFDGTRVVGDTGVVKTDYGYHLMYYVGESSPAWFVSVKNTILGNKSETWFTEKMESFGVTTNKEATNKITA